MCWPWMAGSLKLAGLGRGYGPDQAAGVNLMPLCPCLSFLLPSFLPSLFLLSSSFSHPFPSSRLLPLPPLPPPIKNKSLYHFTKRALVIYLITHSSTDSPNILPYPPPNIFTNTHSYTIIPWITLSRMSLATPCGISAMPSTKCTFPISLSLSPSPFERELSYKEYWWILF